MTEQQLLTAARALDLDQEALAQLLGRVREVAALAGATPVNLDALETLRWPGVIRDTDTGTEDLLIAARTERAALPDGVALTYSISGPFPKVFCPLPVSQIERCQRHYRDRIYS